MYRDCIAPDSDMLSHVCLAFKRYHMKLYHLQTKAASVCKSVVNSSKQSTLFSISASKHLKFVVCRHLVSGEIDI